jgi:hypothetical protein
MAPPRREREETLKRAQGLSEQEVLDELKKHGVTDLETLVRERLSEVKTLDVEEAGSILIYKCFILADWS